MCACACVLPTASAVGQLLSSYGLWGYASHGGEEGDRAWFPLVTIVAGAALVGWAGLATLFLAVKVRVSVHVCSCVCSCVSLSLLLCLCMIVRLYVCVTVSLFDCIAVCVCVPGRSGAQSLLAPMFLSQFVSVSLLLLVIPLEELAIGIAAQTNATHTLFGINGVSLAAMTIIVHTLPP